MRSGQRRMCYQTPRQLSLKYMRRAHATVDCTFLTADVSIVCAVNSLSSHLVREEPQCNFPLNTCLEPALPLPPDSLTKRQSKRDVYLYMV
jgi:hypothetical protein